MNETQPLAGQRCLVLGAGTEAGRAIAVAFAAAGATIAVASATTDGDEVMAARRTRRAVEALGRRAAEYALDTTLGQNVQVSTRQVAKELGGLDVLVTTQNYPSNQPAERTSDSDWARTLALNLGGVFFACRAAAREMGANGGCIIIVAPSLTPDANGQAAAYVAAVNGVVGLARALAREYAGRGIRVYAIRSGAPDGEPAATSAPDLGLADELGAVSLALAQDAGGGYTGTLIGVTAAR